MGRLERSGFGKIHDPRAVHDDKARTSDFAGARLNRFPEIGVQNWDEIRDLIGRRLGASTCKQVMVEDMERVAERLIGPREAAALEMSPTRVPRSWLALAHSSTARGRSAALVGCPTRTLAPPLVLMWADPSHPRHAVISFGAAPGRRGSRQTGSWPSLPCRPAT